MNRTKTLFLALLTTLLLLAGMALGAQGAAPEPAAGGAFGLPNPILEPQDKAAIIKLDAEVDDMMLRSIRRRVDLANRAGCSVIIFEVDTYGGQVTSAIEISKLIKELATKKIITVAWVHHKAYSAGAMITAACQHVVMSREGTYGLCAPIAVATTWTGGHELMPVPVAERAKMEDPVIQEFDNSAERNGWNKIALRAMVVVGAQVHEMRNNNTGEIAYVDDDGMAKLLAQKADLPGGDNASPWKFVSTIDDQKSLLTLDSEMALKMKLSQATVENEEQLRGVLNLRGEPLVMPFSWAERATVFLTTWGMRMMLFAGLVVFGFLEFSHPGLSVFGIVAIICLVLLVGAPFLTGLAQVWEIALIVVGLGIIVVDLLAFGGVGMLAIPGFILMAIGLIASFIPLDADGSFLSSWNSWYAAEKGLGMIVCGTFLAGGIFWMLTKYLHITPGFNRLQLSPGGQRGALTVGVGGLDEVRDVADRPAGEAVFVGAIGLAATDLRPAGKARFGEHLVNVYSHGTFIEQGTEVEILEISGMKIVVRPHVTPTIA